MLNLKLSLGMLLVVTALGIFPCSSEAQTAKTTKTLIGSDNWPVKISYYPSSAGKDSPVVVFLHGEDQHRGFWEIEGKSWPAELQKKGVACITVDLRKHGESKPPGVERVKLGTRDYQAMAGVDMAAVKRFIFKEHQAEKLNMRKMGIVASEMSCAVALVYAALDWEKKPWPDAAVMSARTPRGQDVHALVLVSPDERVAGLSTGRAVSALRHPSRGIGVLVIYADKDPSDAGAAHDIFESFKKSETEGQPRIYEIKFPSKSQGVELIVENSQAQTAFLKFIQKSLGELQIEWVDRKSPIDTSID